jgi:hypothetical protein
MRMASGGVSPMGRTAYALVTRSSCYSLQRLDGLPDLTMKKALLLLLLIAPFVCAPAQAQTFDLTTGRLPVASLDGLWRFHTGDNPAWADPAFDDSTWPLLRSNEDWGQQGFPGYSGVAWYRWQVIVPAQHGPLALLLPRIFSNYQLYANGRLVGGCGQMPPHPEARFCIPALYDLPPEVFQGSGNATIALRVWQQVSWSSYIGGGPHGTSFLGSTPLLRARLQSLFDAHIHSTFEVYFITLLAALGALVSLGLFLYRRSEREYLWFGCMLLIEALSDAYYLYQGLHSVEVRSYYRYSNLLSCLGDFAAVAFYFNLLRGRRSWLLYAAVTGISLDAIADLLFSLPNARDHVPVPVVDAFGLIVTLPFIAWILSLLLQRAKEKLVDARLLLAPVLLIYGNLILTGLAVTTNQFGWQHRFAARTFAVFSQPFPVDSNVLSEFLFLIAMLAILVNRFARTRSQEKRFEGEVLAARNVQQYLIPENLPHTPGLAIESQYRPAREVGGDFFQVLPHATDSGVLIVVGDVAGKGMQAGMLATLIVGAIRTAAAFTTDPAGILTLLNERMHGRGMATCLALRIERDGSATLVNAGHLPPYLNGNELPMEGALPLGAIPVIDFPVLRFKLSEGDSLTLMTDGVAEAQDPAGHLFGFDRISEMLRKGVAAAALAKAAQNFGQEDDITVLTVARMAAAV